MLSSSADVGDTAGNHGETHRPWTPGVRSTGWPMPPSRPVVAVTCSLHDGGRDAAAAARLRPDLPPAPRRAGSRRLGRERRRRPSRRSPATGSSATALGPATDSASCSTPSRCPTHVCSPTLRRLHRGGAGATSAVPESRSVPGPWRSRSAFPRVGEIVSPSRGAAARRQVRSTSRAAVRRRGRGTCTPAASTCERAATACRCSSRSAA